MGMDWVIPATPAPRFIPTMIPIRTSYAPPMITARVSTIPTSPTLTATGGAGTPPTGGSASGRAAQAQVVLLKTTNGLEPRVVRIGISDFDYSEVLDGLKEGDEVALLSVVAVQAKRQSDQAQMKQRMGSGMPGVGSAPTGGGRGAGGGR